MREGLARVRYLRTFEGTKVQYFRTFVVRTRVHVLYTVLRLDGAFGFEDLELQFGGGTVWANI